VPNGALGVVKMASDFETLGDAFPEVNPGVTPLGARVLFQLKSVKKASRGGIIFVEETRATEQAQSLIAKVISVGPLAFHNRDSGEAWKEGVWVKPGDYCRVPRWSGDRFQVPNPLDEKDDISFQIMNDFEIFCSVDPDKVLSMKQFV